MLGPYSGGLDASGEDVVLKDANDVKLDEVDYGVGFPWPTVGDPPGYSLELINPNLDNNGQAVHYTSMVYVPASQNPGWTAHNAGEDTTNSNTSGWYFTGTAGALTGCNQTTYCTLSEAEAKVPNGTILTAGISKGRDNPFSGAVDALVVNSTTYDFEPFGVTARTS